MALSNWDLLAFDTEGKPMNGDFEFENGTFITIYKNWASVYKTRQDDAPIMTLQHGDLFFNGVQVNAVRHEGQGSIFIYAVCTHWEDDDNGKQQRREERFCGIGCYGYMSKLDWIKKNQPELLDRVPRKFLEDPKCDTSECGCWGPDGDHDEITFTIYVNPDDPKAADYDYHDRYTLFLESSNVDTWQGVNPETFAAFKEWMETFKDDWAKNEEWIDSLTQDSARRINQGDMFFSKAVGADLNSSKIGEQQPTILSQIISGMKKEDSAPDEGTESKA